MKTALRLTLAAFGLPGLNVSAQTPAGLDIQTAAGLTIKAEPNRGWRIKASTDLLTWQTLTPVTSATVGFQFTDTAAAGMARRFYCVESE